MRDVRRFLVESCGLTKSDVDNVECGNEDLQQVFLWALGLEQAPRSNHYSNYGLPLAVYYLLPTPYKLLPTTGAPAPPTTGLQMCASPLRPPPPHMYKKLCCVVFYFVLLTVYISFIFILLFYPYDSQSFTPNVNRLLLGPELWQPSRAGTTDIALQSGVAKVGPLLAHFPELRKAVEMEVPGSCGPCVDLRLADLLIGFVGWSTIRSHRATAKLACWVGAVEMSSAPWSLRGIPTPWRSLPSWGPRQGGTWTLPSRRPLPARRLQGKLSDLARRSWEPWATSQAVCLRWRGGVPTSSRSRSPRLTLAVPSRIARGLISGFCL